MITGFLKTDNSHLRIERAKELLDQTQMEIGEISRELGFNDVKFLSTAFRKATGNSPTEHRSRSNSDK